MTTARMTANDPIGEWRLLTDAGVKRGLAKYCEWLTLTPMDRVDEAMSVSERRMARELGQAR